MNGGNCQPPDLSLYEQNCVFLLKHFPVCDWKLPTGKLTSSLLKGALSVVVTPLSNSFQCKIVWGPRNAGARTCWSLADIQPWEQEVLESDMVSAAVEGDTPALHNSHAWKTQQPTGARLSLLQMEWMVQRRCALGCFFGSRGAYPQRSFRGMDKLFHDAPCNYSQGRSNLRSAENHRTTVVSKNTAPFLREEVLTWPGLTAAALGSSQALLATLGGFGGWSQTLTVSLY